MRFKIKLTPTQQAEIQAIWTQHGDAGGIMCCQPVLREGGKWILCGKVYPKEQAEGIKAAVSNATHELNRK